MHERPPRLPDVPAGGETSEIRSGELAGVLAPHPQPGLVVVFGARRAMCRAIAVGAEPLVLGREAVPPGVPMDTAMSRRHTSVAHDGRAWTVTDLGSRNGTFVDGQVLGGNSQAHASRPPATSSRPSTARQRVAESPRVLRIGHTVAVFAHDVRPFLALGGKDLRGDGGMVSGPALSELWRFLAMVAPTAKNLHIRGESGTGKELVARAFHDGGPHRAGPFIAVNCAAIPESLAERLLFGAKKGAFSGADQDSEGYLQAADGGTLFLDEIGELEASLQAKLLRVLETREVLQLGATRAKKVAIHVCSATHRDLRALVEDGRFRQDLYFRLSRPDVRLPPLRERPEEIAYHLVAAVRAVDPELEVDATLVEASLLRMWPGNVRELLIESTQAAQVARVRAERQVLAEHLHAEAGAGPTGPAVATASVERPEATSELPPREVILEALRNASGKVATAARQLGISRIRLRRWLQREGLGSADEPGAVE